MSGCVPARPVLIQDGHPMGQKLGARPCPRKHGSRLRRLHPDQTRPDENGDGMDGWHQTWGGTEVRGACQKVGVTVPASRGR